MLSMDLIMQCQNQVTIVFAYTSIFQAKMEDALQLKFFSRFCHSSLQPPEDCDKIDKVDAS